MLPSPDAARGPDLELDWELGLFKAIRGLWRRLMPQDRSGPTGARVDVDPERWRLLASLVAGRPLRVSVAQGGGGIRGDELRVPPMDLAPGADEGLLLLRVVVDATTAGRPAGPDAEAEARQSVQTLSDTLPRFAAAWAEAMALVRRVHPHADTGTVGPAGLLWGPRLEVRDVDAGSGPDDPGAQPPASGASEAQARTADALEVLALSDDDVQQLPIHAFEKVETLESFSGALRQLDGEDDLNDHLDALDEVDLGHLVRGGPQAHSVLRADVALDAEVPDVHHIAPDEAGIAYDEWDGRRRRWRPGWCHVYPARVPSGGDGRWAAAAAVRHRALIERLHSAMLVHRQRRRPRRRQTDGADVDIDALVDAMAQLRAGRDPGERLYVRRPRHVRDVATTVLLDLSLSTDAWVEDRRVLDVARESVLVLGEVAERLGDRLQVLAFASHTRHKVRVWTVRDWDEPWQRARERLGRLTPQGYTRIGPALRHATAGLAAVDARDRLLLLVSDGKPTDYDRYEGRYGMADVRMALREARDAGVRVHALAVDAVARHTLPTMLGPGGWDVLPHPDHLPEALTRAWGRRAS